MPKGARIVFNNNVAYIYFRHRPDRKYFLLWQNSQKQKRANPKHENMTKMTLQNYYFVQSTFIYQHNQSIIRSVTVIEAGSVVTTSFIGRLLIITEIPIRWPS